VGSTSHALLQRSMNFGAIQTAVMVGSLTSTTCAIAAAALGAGAWALVLQQVVLASVTTALFILPARWRPSLEFSRPHMRSLSKFAFPYTGASIFFLLQQVVAALFIGHFAGLEDLGIWNLSWAIVWVPLSLLALPIGRVIYAAFARLREDQERVADMWLKGVSLLAAVGLPALFGLIAVAPDVIPFAFGSQWRPAVPTVQILCVMIMCQTLIAWNDAVLDAAGRPHVVMLLKAAVLIALVPAIWLASGFGIEAVAIAFTLTTLVFGQIPSFVLTIRQLSLSGLTVLGRLRGIAPAAALTCVAVVFVRQALEDQGVAIEPRVALSILAGAVIYVLALTVLARGVARELIGVARGLLPARQATS
jgi:O-antigen/teichoic acid export membrane protein